MDKDFVVVDSCQKELESLGFMKVGKSHDVYLHPKTREEYTLAVNNSIVENLQRDLTINSIAVDQKTGEFFDPLGGRKDISLKVLRHNPFFDTDPVRVLRLMRFKARLEGFKVAAQTQIFVDGLLKNSSLFTGISEQRISNELIKGFNSNDTNSFISEIDKSHVLDLLYHEKVNLSLVQSHLEFSLNEKVALCFFHDGPRAIENFLEKFLFPKESVSLCLDLKRVLDLDIKDSEVELLSLLETMRWSESDGRFDRVLSCLEKMGELTKVTELENARKALKGIDYKEVTQMTSIKMPKRLFKCSFTNY